MKKLNCLPIGRQTWKEARLVYHEKKPTYETGDYFKTPDQTEKDLAQLRENMDIIGPLKRKRIERIQGRIARIERRKGNVEARLEGKNDRRLARIEKRLDRRTARLEKRITHIQSDERLNRWERQRDLQRDIARFRQTPVGSPDLTGKEISQVIPPPAPPSSTGWYDTASFFKPSTARESKVEKGLETSHASRLQKIAQALEKDLNISELQAIAQRLIPGITPAQLNDSDYLNTQKERMALKLKGLPALTPQDSLQLYTLILEGEKKRAPHMEKIGFIKAQVGQLKNDQVVELVRKLNPAVDQKKISPAYIKALRQWLTGGKGGPVEDPQSFTFEEVQAAYEYLQGVALQTPKNRLDTPPSTPSLSKAEDVAQLSDQALLAAIGSQL